MIIERVIIIIINQIIGFIWGIKEYFFSLEVFAWYYYMV